MDTSDTLETSGETGIDADSGSAAEPPITILVADDHPVVRAGLVSLIARCPEMRVIAEAGNGLEALERYAAKRPAVVLLDLRMPVMDGVQAATAICEQEPEARLIMLSTYQGEEDIYRALRAGVRGYILKDSPLQEFMDCIHTVARGGTWIPALIGAKLARRMMDPELTAREMDVLRCVVRGKSNKEIGADLDISEATVKVHVAHILEKLKVTGRAEAIHVAVRRGLVRIDSPTAA
ncbi:MAG TPA: response regulator transcription factor [Acidobacteriaceae bacterium]|nr:response regulator transcription factor [Acidobacteriaceae bacterium]